MKTLFCFFYLSLLVARGSVQYSVYDMGYKSPGQIRIVGINGEDFVHTEDLLSEMNQYGYVNYVNNGQIAGRYLYLDPNYGYVYHAYVASGGIRYDIGTLGGSSSWARCVNSSGFVVGKASVVRDGFNFDHAFLYAYGGISDIGTLTGFGYNTSSMANGINDSNLIVGSSWSGGGGGEHAFSYSDGNMTDLGTLVGSSSLYLSSAFGVNNGGDIVGWSYFDNDSPRTHAFIYSDGVMFDLNNMIDKDQGWVVEGAYAISDGGSIVCYGYGKDNLSHELWLRPVPEPSTFGIAVLCVFIYTFNLKKKFSKLFNH